MPSLPRDLTLGFRALLRMRSAGVVAVCTLALGIAATTTMASVGYATLFRPVPFAEADRLAILYNTRQTPRDGLVRLRWSFPHVTELRTSTTSFEGMATFSSTSVSVRRSGLPEQRDGEVASPEYFSLLRTSPIAGRTYAPADEGQPVVMISERFWRTEFDADAGAIGSVLRVSDQPVTVIGILPEGFAGLSGKAMLWMPPWMAPRLSYGDYLTSMQHFISVVSRLKPGVSLERANAELVSVGARFHDEPVRADAVWSAAALTATDARVDPTGRRSVVLLFSASACVLLIACINVAGLLLARARTRGREMAIRRAIGASRGRLLLQLLSEGFALAAVAGVIGTAMAVFGVRAVSSTSPSFIASWRNDYAAISPFADPSIDTGLLLFVLAVTLGTTLLSSLAPAIAASRPRPATGFGLGERGTTRNSRALSGLVVTEIAAAVLLLTAAGLVVDSLSRLQNLRTGFDPERVMTFWIRPPVLRYPPETGPATIQKFFSAIEAVPGVESAAVNRATPFIGGARTSLTFTDRSNVPGQLPVVGRHYISAGYFDTLGIPLRAGRRLTPADRLGAAPVTVINETAARRYWPAGNAIGQHVTFGSSTGFTDPKNPVEIVGIVGDVKYDGGDQPIVPDFYTSYLQFAYPDTMMMVKTRGEPNALVPALRAALASVDASVPMYDVMTLDERVTRAIGRPRFNAAILTLFAGTALLLAALGVYGVLSFAVSSRLREIGVRLALGAAPGRLLRLFVGQGVRLAVIGVAVGLVAAFALTRSAQSLVADLGTVSVNVLLAVSLLITLVAAAAAFLPARRASVVDPIVVLRND